MTAGKKTIKCRDVEQTLTMAMTMSLAAFDHTYNHVDGQLQKDAFSSLFCWTYLLM